jgi:hypothetical protein
MRQPDGLTSGAQRERSIAVTMLHDDYIVFMLQQMGRPTKDETPVYNRLEMVRTNRGLSRQQLADVLETAVGAVFSLHPWIDEAVPTPTP